MAPTCHLQLLTVRGMCCAGLEPTEPLLKQPCSAFSAEPWTPDDIHAQILLQIQPPHKSKSGCIAWHNMPAGGCQHARQYCRPSCELSTARNLPLRCRFPAGLCSRPATAAAGSPCRGCHNTKQSYQGRQQEQRQQSRQGAGGGSARKAPPHPQQTVIAHLHSRGENAAQQTPVTLCRSCRHVSTLCQGWKVPLGPCQVAAASRQLQHWPQVRTGGSCQSLQTPALPLVGQSSDSGQRQHWSHLCLQNVLELVLL